jgi:uncharacterized protein YecE (DUF72 family)
LRGAPLLFFCYKPKLNQRKILHFYKFFGLKNQFEKQGMKNKDKIMIYVGTSGYSYVEWKGSFYPKDLPTSKMFAFYCDHFRTVEINNTFYRLPTRTMVENWKKSTPPDFKLTFKAPRQITHILRLKKCAETLGLFLDSIQAAEEKLGTVLFQLPPFLKQDFPVLSDFLELLPKSINAVFEFRHESWLNSKTFDLLKEKNIALCIADSEKMHTPLIETADFGYLRLRDEGYTSKDIEGWAEVIRERLSVWKDIYVYFKHEEKGKGPEFARALMKIISS